MQQLNIGIFGFGCVGQGLYHAIHASTGFKTTIKKIVVKNKDKERSLPPDFFSFDKNDILFDENINVVVELIDDADEAFAIVSKALEQGKHVVTANKKMLALHLQTLINLKNKHNVSLLYEAAVCGSIPIIRTLEEYFDNEPLAKISGIFNGTTNYILTKTVNEGISYEQALQQAQASGFAETDPTSDVEGFDATYKTIIAALHGFGIVLQPNNIVRFGISTLQQNDINYAKQHGYKIKLVPTITQLENNKISAYVLPTFTSSKSHLYKVDDEFNGVLVQGQISGEQFFLGRGAGSLPTGAAVLSDISALSYSYAYNNKKLAQQQALVFTNDVSIKVFISTADKNLLQNFKFDKVEEQFLGNNYFYTIGNVSLQNVQSYLENDGRKGVFIGVID